MATTELTDANFATSIDKTGIVVVDFWAGWCGPCRAFAPIFEQAAERHADITWGKVDVDAAPELANTFGIRSIPTLMIFRDGLPVFSQAGTLPSQALDQLVEKVRELDMNEVRRELDEAEGAAGD